MQKISIWAVCVLTLALPAYCGEGDKAEITYKEDLIYGRVAGAALCADVAWPKSDKPLPAIISVHGGRWMGGHKKDTSAIKVEQWAGLGFFAMSIDYRLGGCSPAPAPMQDLQCAIRYVHAHAKELNVDAERIYLIGQSAGGHMVTLAGQIGDGPWPRTGGWEKASNEVRAVISVAACYDLPTLDWGKLWNQPGAADGGRDQASPTKQITEKMKPLLIMHSDNDTSVPIANALLMDEACKKAGVKYKFLRYPTLGHMQIIQEVIDRSLEFIKEH